MSTRVYAPLGMLGYGFPEASLAAAVASRPDLFAVDAGSTDPGPYYLGSGTSFTSRTMVRRDLGLLLRAALDCGVPLVIGSAGGAGGAPHVAWVEGILRELATELRVAFTVAVIDAEIDREFLKGELARGRVHDFEVGRDLRAEDIDACERVVAQMGVEPILAALDGAPDVILAGRAVDAALAASLPIRDGHDLGLALHLGKIVECGSLVALPRESDGVLATIDGDGFVIEPADPNKRCTPELCAAHTLYERSDPYRLAVPGGAVDLREAKFTAVDDRRVRISGSRYVPAERYTVKLEGAALAGRRSLCVAGVRDPRMIDQIDEVVAKVRAKLAAQLGDGVAEDDYQLRFRLYGRDAVMGDLEPDPCHHPHELGVIIDAVAPTQETADVVCALARSAILHMGYEGRIATAGNVAFPFSPAEFPAPPAYEFRVFHLLEVEDPTALFPVRWERVGSRP